MGLQAQANPTESHGQEDTAKKGKGGKGGRRKGGGGKGGGGKSKSANLVEHEVRRMGVVEGSAQWWSLLESERLLTILAERRR